MHRKLLRYNFRPYNIVIPVMLCFKFGNLDDSDYFPVIPTQSTQTPNETTERTKQTRSTQSEFGSKVEYSDCSYDDFAENERTGNTFGKTIFMDNGWN